MTTSRTAALCEVLQTRAVLVSQIDVEVVRAQKETKDETPKEKRVWLQCTQRMDWKAVGDAHLKSNGQDGTKEEDIPC